MADDASRTCAPRSPRPSRSLRDADALEIDALQRNVRANFQQVVQLSPVLSDDLTALAANITEPGRLADFIASSLSTIGTTVKQELLAHARRPRSGWPSSTAS